MRTAFPVSVASSIADAPHRTTRRDDALHDDREVRVAVASATQTWLVLEIPLTAKARRTRPGAGRARAGVIVPRGRQRSRDDARESRTDRK